MCIYIVQIKKKRIKTHKLSWVTGVMQWSCKPAWMTTKKNTASYEIHGLSGVSISFKGLSVASHHLASVVFLIFSRMFPQEFLLPVQQGDRDTTCTQEKVSQHLHAWAPKKSVFQCSMAFELRVGLSLTLCSCSVSKWCFSVQATLVRWAFHGFGGFTGVWR